MQRYRIFLINFRTYSICFFRFFFLWLFTHIIILLRDRRRSCHLWLLYSVHQFNLFLSRFLRLLLIFLAFLWFFFWTTSVFWYCDSHIFVLSNCDMLLLLNLGICYYWDDVTNLYTFFMFLLALNKDFPRLIILRQSGVDNCTVPSFR